TVEPGASEVLTQGWTCKPRSTAFFASKPAPSMTEGFDVLVQLVIAAMTTEPWSREYSPCASWRRTAVGGATACSTPTAVGLPPSPSQRCTCGRGFAGPPGFRMSCSASENDCLACAR